MSRPGCTPGGHVGRKTERDEKKKLPDAEGEEISADRTVDDGDRWTGPRPENGCRRQAQAGAADTGGNSGACFEPGRHVSFMALR